MRAFAKATPISSPSATTTRSSLYETQSLRRWMSHRSGSSPLSAWPTRRFSAAPAAAGPRIPYSYSATHSSENSSIRAHFFCDVANAVPFFFKQHSPGRNVTTAWVSPLAASFIFREQPAPRALPLFSSQGPAGKKERGRGSQRSEMSELTPAVPPYTSLSPQRVFTCYIQ